MHDLLDYLLAKARRRPVRVAEFVLGAAAAVGLTFTDDVAQAVTLLIVAGIGALAGEVAQTRTTPVAAPRLPSARPEEGDPHDPQIGELTELYVAAAQQGLDPEDPASYEGLGQ